MYSKKLVDKQDISCSEGRLVITYSTDWYTEGGSYKKEKSFYLSRSVDDSLIVYASIEITGREFVIIPTGNFIDNWYRFSEIREW